MQEQLAINGHAIEARVYAEDPARDFLPAAGRIEHLRVPMSSAHVRIDSGVREGDEIGVYYDPMIAKLICWDVDRDAALRCLRAALAEYQVVGFATNLRFLSALCAHRAFALAHREPGLLDTGLIGRYKAELLPDGAAGVQPDPRARGAGGAHAHRRAGTGCCEHVCGPLVALERPRRLAPQRG